MYEASEALKMVPCSVRAYAKIRCVYVASPKERDQHSIHSSLTRRRTRRYTTSSSYLNKPRNPKNLRTSRLFLGGSSDQLITVDSRRHGAEEAHEGLGNWQRRKTRCVKSFFRSMVMADGTKMDCDKNRSKVAGNDSLEYKGEKEQRGKEQLKIILTVHYVRP